MWAPELVWTFGRKEKYLVPSGFRSRTIQFEARSLYRLYHDGFVVSYLCRTEERINKEMNNKNGRHRITKQRTMNKNDWEEKSGEREEEN